MDLDAPPLAHPGEVPEVRSYDRVDEAGGRLSGRWRRRQGGEHTLYVLADGTAVRWLRVRGDTVEDHLRDVTGAPSATLISEAGVPARVVLHGVEDRTVTLEGFALTEVPGGQAWLPGGTSPRDGGGLQVDLFGGQLSVWGEEPAAIDADAFTEGLLAGSGGALFERRTCWVDGRPALAVGLEVPPDGALVELVVVPIDQGTLVLAWRAPSGVAPVEASLTARALPALLDLNELPSDRERP